MIDVYFHDFATRKTLGRVVMAEVPRDNDFVILEGLGTYRVSRSTEWHRRDDGYTYPHVAVSKWDYDLVPPPGHLHPVE